MAGRRPQIHEYAQQGDVSGVQAELAKGIPVDLRDPSNDWTPLMVAVSSAKAGVELVQLLIHHDADVNAIAGDPQAATSREGTRRLVAQIEADPNLLAKAASSEGLQKSLQRMRDRLAEDPRDLTNKETVLSLAIGSGNLERVKVLLDAGADIHYVRNSGYDALIDVMYSRAIEHAPLLLPLVQLLIQRGARLDTVTRYSESALKIAASRGRFDVVGTLLNAGANPAPLGWTPLMYAIALGTCAEVQAQLQLAPDLEARDFCSRTPWHLSLQTGSTAKVRLLMEAGVDKRARGRRGTPALMYPIHQGDTEMVQFILAEGFDPNETDEFGTSPLIEAASYGATDIVKLLLRAGADINHECHSRSPMKAAANLQIVDLLVAAGADLNDISDAMRAALTRLPSDGRIDVTAEEYREQKHRRFGTANPERMDLPFWRSMVRNGLYAYGARRYFDDTECDTEAVWCFQRYGKSINRLPDGRIIEIGGEHEDHYDPDFCIYNDVVVHHGDGTFDIFGYPKECFPPTDFHSATHVGKWIYIIGSLGYHGERKPGQTPVYRLDLDSYRIGEVTTSGDNPGWIHRHKAKLIGVDQIRITGGKVYAEESGKGDLVDNSVDYILDLTTLAWREAR